MKIITELCLAAAVFLFPVLSAAISPGERSVVPDSVKVALEQMRMARAENTPKYCMIVSVSEQKLYLYDDDDQLGAIWPVSTSMYGIGAKANSLKTPLGLHEIYRKIGQDAPLGAVFRGRRQTGQIAAILTEAQKSLHDLVTSRVLWLNGLEPGVNSGDGRDSRRRYIYIHGTDEEGLIGSPASHGCVRMKNTDVIELFDAIDEGALVNIIP